MSTRTKSFFDHNQNKRQRPGQWSHPQERPPLHDKGSNTAPAKPPIPATSQAKTKLKAFQFVPGHPTESDSAEQKENVADVENQNTNEEKHGDNEGLTGVAHNVVIDPAGYDPTTSAPKLPHAHTFPSTPGTRLSLEDLIGNYDEKRAAPQNESPEEYVGWIPNSSSALLTPNRKRKRARSSSPSSCPNTSSQRQEALASVGGQTVSTEKNTQADPSADLWQRVGGETVTNETKAPDFSHLMFQASPRANETPAKGGGFRRWASTGNEWPTTNNKRRRTNGHTSIRLLQDVVKTGTNEKSKFADMLKKVEESLATQRIAKEQSKPAVRVEAPSSSSPLPEVSGAGAFADRPAASPLETRHKAMKVSSRNTSPKAMARSVDEPKWHVRDAEEESGIPLPRDQPAVNEPALTGPLYLQSKAPLPPYKRPSITRTPSNENRQPDPRPATSIAVHAPTEGSDDFGDDFELLAEDLEELDGQKPAPLEQEDPAYADAPIEEPSEHLHGIDHIAQHQSDLGTLAQPIQLDEFDDGNDEFGMDDIDEASFAVAEMNVTQTLRLSPRKQSQRKSRLHSTINSTPSKSKLSQKTALKYLHRYSIKQIVDGEYTDAKGRRCTERVLLAEEERTLIVTAITLRDSWASTSVSIGNIVHVAELRRASANKASTYPPGQIIVSNDDDNSLLIVHPDHMLSATTVADSFDCIRKAVLQDRIKATGETSKAMVYGKILHEIFQQALSSNRWSDSFLAELVVLVVQNHVQSLWELGMHDTVFAIEEITAKLAELASWARIFVAETPSEVTLVDDKQGEKLMMSISKLIAIEEHIWSPQYGLKGNIDATVQMTLVERTQQPSKKLIMPFEVKTGRTTQSPAHRAQTALYTLLLSDRYQVPVEAGMLYYLESSAMTRIAPPVHQIRQMIQQRNRLAAYLHRARNPAGELSTTVAAPQTQEIEASGLPAPLKDPFKCGRCYAQQSCFMYHALAENGTADSAGMLDDGKKDHTLVWKEAVGHLQLSNSKERADAEKMKSWFAKWDRLLTFEESDLSKLRRELWTMDSTEREAAGRCFANLVIKQDLTSASTASSPSLVDGIEGSGGKINRFAYELVQAERSSGHSFVQGTQLTVGEPVVVSSENGQWALANGYVVAAAKHSITVAVDRKLGNARKRLSNFDDERNQAFKGIMAVGNPADPTADTDGSPVIYRLDKDEFSNGLALVRNNLVTMMSSHPIHKKLRDLLILDKAPEFCSPTQRPHLVASQLGEMNEDQLAAVDKVLSAQDYALILGMPGTGKTTTIAHIIRALLAEQKSILLASFTHTAVDNILLKIRDIAPPNSILRVGVPAKINAQVQEFCKLAATPRKTIEEVEDAFMGSLIVATTCMGTNHPLFGRRAFDVCIVDEASQITLPTSLGPLLRARKFILVGDHYQLPPLVQNRAALEHGLDVSLFRQLSEAHPEAIAKLRKQYRMCEDVMSLSNTLIYDGQLRCGNDGVAQRTLGLGPLSALEAFHTVSSTCQSPAGGNACWIANVVGAQRKVVFANTDASGVSAHETLTLGKNITNQLEATLVAQLVLSLLALGVPGTEIGVITLYRSQLALIRQLFKKAGIGPEVEIDSADRFQGRDKECIVLSMVRSNEAGVVGELLKDWRRVNVALTRARSKLIMLGSRGTLCNNELLARLLSLVDRRGWAVELPKDADAYHAFSFSSQAASELVTQGLKSPDAAHVAVLPSPRQLKVGGGASQRASQQSPRRALRDSPNVANQGVAKYSGQKQPGKIMFGKNSPAATSSSKWRKAMEQVAFDIFEDINADDF